MERAHVIAIITTMLGMKTGVRMDTDEHIRNVVSLAQRIVAQAESSARLTGK